MKIKLHYSVFLIILILGIFFRSFNLKNIPPSIFSDEVDIGYQALTYNRTHTDYFGNKFPLFFQSYADWHAPFAIFPVSIFQKIIGVNIYSLKIPSILFGIVSLIFFYLLIKNISKSKSMALISLLLISFSPWHIHYSRTNFEAVSGMILFLILGIFFWAKYLNNKKNNFLYLSLICFCLTPYFYGTAKLFLFFLFLSLIIVWRKKILSLKIKQKFLSIIICFIILFPLIYSTLFTESNSRFAYISIFSDPTISSQVDYQRFSDATLTHQGQIGINPNFLSKAFNNKITVIGRTFLKNYFSSFSTEFLILQGDSNLRQGFKFQGYFFYFDLFIIFLGIYYAFLKEKKFSTFFLLLLLFAPIPFSLTRDSNSAHATRLILMLPSLIYFLSFGYQKILKTSKIIFTLLLFIFVLNFSLFWYNYNIQYPQISARYWHTGIKEIILSSESQKNNFSKIFYSGKDESMLPFFLYYTQYQSSTNPSDPVKSFIWDNSHFFTGLQTDNKYYFGLIEWDNLLNNSKNCPDCLFVLDDREYKEIISKNNNSELKIIDTQKTKYSDNYIYYLVSVK